MKEIPWQILTSAQPCRSGNTLSCCPCLACGAPGCVIAETTSHQSDIAHVIIHETPTQFEILPLRHYTCSLTRNINTVNRSLLAVSRAQATEKPYLISHSLFTTCIQSPNKHQHCQSTITWIQPPRNQQHQKSTHKLLLAFIIPTTTKWTLNVKQSFIM